MKTKEIKVGDTVKYSREWLRNVGLYTGDTPFAKGVVTDLISLGSFVSPFILAEINWGAYEEPNRVNVKNLSVVSSDGQILENY